MYDRSCCLSVHASAVRLTRPQAAWHKVSIYNGLATSQAYREFLFEHPEPFCPASQHLIMDLGAPGNLTVFEFRATQLEEITEPAAFHNPHRL